MIGEEALKKRLCRIYNKIDFETVPSQSSGLRAFKKLLIDMKLWNKKYKMAEIPKTVDVPVDKILNKRSFNRAAKMVKRITHVG